MAITHIHIRDARDRLIDLLGIGQTYPLRDLAVRDEQLTVAFGTSAKVPIAPSQVGVAYQLYDKDNTPVPGTAVQGNGDRAIMETPRIREDLTYTISARKLLTGRTAVLRETATIKVGLDVSLQAWIRNAPALVPTIDNLDPTAPRLVSYGTSVEVELRNSQEGVDYRLVSLAATSGGRPPQETEISVAAVRGNLRNIVLTSNALFEDTDLRIRATKVFDPSENRPSQTALLDVVLPLKVIANVTLPVSVVTAIVDFNQVATLVIGNTQRSTRYQVYVRTLLDRDFIHTAVSDTPLLIVPVMGKPDVQVRRPQRGDTWSPPPGYQAVGESHDGVGGELRLTISDLRDDSIMIVQAQKEHQTASGSVPSAIQLEQAALILVRPDPTPGLTLQVLSVTEMVQAAGGQAGVFYAFRLDPNGQDIAPPVYFHKRDDEDQRLNKGIGQLAMTIDFVIARHWSPEKIQAAAGLAQTPPELPVLEASSLQSGVSVYVRAMKAQTGVSVELTHPVLVQPQTTT